MNNENFSKLVEETCNEIKNTLIKKGLEYAVGEDRISNLKDIASLCKMEPEQVLFVLAAKHLIAARDAIFELPDKTRSKEFYTEKTGDMVNYYGPLLRALLKDRGAL